MDVGNLFFTGDLVHIVGTKIDDRAFPKAVWFGFASGWLGYFSLGSVGQWMAEWGCDWGQETCRVGFLQRSYVAHFQRYSGKFAQVREIWSADDESATQRQMFYHNHGCCVAGMMGPNVIPKMNDTSYDNKSDDDDDPTDDEQSSN